MRRRTLLHTIKKRLLWSVIGVFLSTVFLAGSGGMGVMASTINFGGFDATQISDAINSSSEVNAGTDNGIADDVKNMEQYVQALYLVLWPSLAIAGASLDNSLVYGNAFFLEKSLFGFWQMMRTFANFALGFIFAGSILFAFFRPNANQGENRVVSLLKKLVIAGLLINMSRWMVASLIDFSTIATTAMGGLPLHVMGEIEEWKDLRLLKSHSLIDNSEIDNETITKMTRSTIYSCAGSVVRQFYIPCPINNNFLFDAQGDATEPLSFDNARKKYAEAWEGRSLQSGIQNTPGVGIGISSLPIPVTEGDFSNQYCVYGNTLISYDDTVNLTSQPELEPLKEAGTAHMKSSNCATMKDLVEKSTASTGPLFALYGSILHMATISQTSNFGNAAEILIELIMKVFVGAALIIPLFALALALVVRVVFLWLIIAFSPILVLAYVFKSSKINEIAEGKFKIGTVIGLIFLPVFAVFAVSISVVFLTVLGNIDMIETWHEKAESAKEQPDGGKNDAVTILGIANRFESAEGEKCYDFKITNICFTETQRKTGADIVNVMVWTVINFFGIALMWTAIFFVLKGNAVTASVANGVEKLAKQGLKSIKFIPMPDGSATSVGALQAAQHSLSNRFGPGLHQKQFDESAWNPLRQQQIKEGIDTLKKSPEDITTFNAYDGTSPDDYDKAVPSIVNKINSSENTKMNGLKVKDGTENMEGLMASPAFARYYMTQRNADYGQALNNLVKSENSGVRAAYTGKYIESLEALADEATANGNKAIPDAADPTNPKRKIKYIMADNKLVRIPYRIKEYNNTTLKIAEFENIKQYSLPNGELTELTHLSNYKALIQDNGVDKNSPNIPKELTDMYRASIKDKIVLTDEQKKLKSATVSIQLGGQSAEVNVAIKDGKPVSILPDSK